MHGRTVVWLWWTLWFRRWHRDGPGLRAVGIVVGVVALAAAGTAFLAGLAVGLWLLPAATPWAVLLVWDGLVVAFVAMRLVWLLVDPHQRDAVPLARLLHLPLAPGSVFALNFALSEMSFAVVVFLPALLGLAIASSLAIDAATVVLVPASLALGLCVAAVAYQFRTWLASTMARARQRVPVGIVFLFSALLAINGFSLFSQLEVLERRTQLEAAQQPVLERTRQDAAAWSGERMGRFETNVRIASVLLPPGWVALAAESAARGSAWPGILAIGGLSIITGLSLRQSYRSTLAFHRQTAASSDDRGPRRAGGAQRRPRVEGSPRASPLTLVIARTTWRTWMRSPRGKVLPFFLPLFMGMLPGFAAATFPDLLAAETRILTTVGLLGLSNISAVALACNVFGVDGGGFRLFIVAPVSRRAVLVGKYVAGLPVFVLAGGAVLVCIQVLAPLGLWHLVGVSLQGGVLFLASSVVAGELSMRAPYAVSTTSFYSPKSDASGFLGMLAMLAVAASVVAAAAAALAVERWIGYSSFTLLSTAELAGALWLWRLAVSRQADKLEARANRIEQRLASDR